MAHEEEKKQTTETPIEFTVEGYTLEAPFVLDDESYPSVVQAEFDFVEPDRLRGLVRELHFRNFLKIKITEHVGPGRGRVVFEGAPADYLL